MSQYTKNDAAKETSSTPKEVSKAWHNAKDDDAKEKDSRIPKDRHNKDK